MLSITTTVDGNPKNFPFFWVFSGGEERREEGRGGGKGGREGGREGGGRKGRLHVRIMNDVLSENDPFLAKKLLGCALWYMLERKGRERARKQRDQRHMHTTATLA